MAGCAAPSGYLQQPVLLQAGHYQVSLPAGWVRYPVGSNSVLTRDGVAVQQITLVQRGHLNAFPRIERSTQPDSTAEELAEFYIAELREEFGPIGLTIVDNRPMRIGSRTAFRLQLQWRNSLGLRWQAVAVGTTGPSGIFLAAYRAPNLHYFERDLPVFERLLDSITFNQNPPKS